MRFYKEKAVFALKKYFYGQNGVDFSGLSSLRRWIFIVKFVT